MTDATCPVWFTPDDGWTSRQCGRPVKRNGKCGIHATVEEKRAAGRANAEAQRRERVRRADEADRYCHRLRSLGVACTTDGEHVYLTDPAALVDSLTGVRAEYIRQAAEIAWDKAVESLRYEDGTPVEIVTTVNPYRAATPEGN